MRYVSAKAYAQKHGISVRWVHELCKSGRIPGASRLNGDGAWMIPEESEIQSKPSTKSIGLSKEEMSMVNAEKQMETGQLLLTQSDLDMAAVYFEFAGEEFVRRNDFQNALIAYEKTLYCFETAENTNRIEEIKSIINNIKNKSIGG